MTKRTLIQLTGGRILRNHKIIQESLWIDRKRGKIVNPKSVSSEDMNKAKSEHIGDSLIVPGFIDLHIQGGFGIDLTYDMQHHPEALNNLSKKLLTIGITSFCPTLVSSRPEVYQKIIQHLGAKPGGVEGANILGGHIEGPFINIEKLGKHGSKFVMDLEDGVETVLKIYKNMTTIKIITLAPEKDKGMKVIEWLTKNNIIVSLGHTLATLEEAEEAVEKGATILGHFYNSMTDFHHRAPGILGLLTSQKIKDKIYYTIVSDGIHIHPAALKIAYSNHPKGVILTTLANAAMGLPKKKIHHIGEQVFEVHKNIGYIAKTAKMAGGLETITFCIKTFIEATGCSLITALEAVTLQPAKALGIENEKGTLNFESDADLVILNDNLDILSTWVAGRKVYSITTN